MRYSFQGTSYTSPQTRYYYNLSHTPVEDAGNLTTPQDVVTWSASQFAAENIRQYLCKKAGAPAVISDTIDLTHYSYYPVTPLNTVTLRDATLKFGFDVIEGVEEGNKKPSESKQHYLMQCGLLYNAKTNVTVENVTLSGVVGKTTNGSSALIYGTVSGSTDTNPVQVKNEELEGVTLAGLRVNGGNSGEYAPLLINRIQKAVTLTVKHVETGAQYTNDTTKMTQKAAFSLIGEVGSAEATNLTLTFDDIALDSRTYQGDSTVVKNNGSDNAQVVHNTYASIFTRAAPCVRLSPHTALHRYPLKSQL